MLQEMKKFFGKDTNREITYEDLNKLNYCGAIIKEGDLNFFVLFEIFLNFKQCLYQIFSFAFNANGFSFISRISKT